MIAIAVVIAASNATSTKKNSITGAPILALFNPNYRRAVQKLVKAWLHAVKFGAWAAETRVLVAFWHPGIQLQLSCSREK